MSLSAFSRRMFPTIRSQVFARAAPASFARFYATKQYTQEHEWIEIENGVAKVGITDYAQNSLGEIVFVEPSRVGDDVQVGDNIGSVESVKAASDIYAPVAGKIIEFNEALSEEPGLLNSEPLEGGWLCKLQIASDADLSSLLDESAYNKFVSESH